MDLCQFKFFLTDTGFFEPVQVFVKWYRLFLSWYKFQILINYYSTYNIKLFLTNNVKTFEVARVMFFWGRVMVEIKYIIIVIYFLFNKYNKKGKLQQFLCGTVGREHTGLRS